MQIQLQVTLPDGAYTELADRLSTRADEADLSVILQRYIESLLRRCGAVTAQQIVSGTTGVSVSVLE